MKETIDERWKTDEEEVRKEKRDGRQVDWRREIKKKLVLRIENRKEYKRYLM